MTDKDHFDQGLETLIRALMTKKKVCINEDLDTLSQELLRTKEFLLNKEIETYKQIENRKQKRLEIFLLMIITIILVIVAIMIGGKAYLKDISDDFFEYFSFGLLGMIFGIVSSIFYGRLKK